MSNIDKKREPAVSKERAQKHDVMLPEDGRPRIVLHLKRKYIGLNRNGSFHTGGGAGMPCCALYFLCMCSTQ